MDYDLNVEEMLYILLEDEVYETSYVKDLNELNGYRYGDLYLEDGTKRLKMYYDRDTKQFYGVFKEILGAHNNEYLVYTFPELNEETKQELIKVSYNRDVIRKESFRYYRLFAFIITSLAISFGFSNIDGVLAVIMVILGIVTAVSLTAFTTYSLLKEKRNNE